MLFCFPSMACIKASPALWERGLYMLSPSALDERHGMGLRANNAGSGDRDL